ncbi:diguanylate cyclase [Cellulomonas sp. 179-A 4D5 NHS]|uniref:diguanylate cyclase domain-containing protein n=1 Tax=Cellulomonas sp. 179-A 4D5 NHS TaxID=3142378 RepID=UPI0039A1E227
MSHDRSERASLAAHSAFLVTATGISVAYGLTDGAARSVVFLESTLVPGAAVVLTLVARRPPRPQPWWCASAALMLLTVDNIAWLVQVGIGGATHATGIIPAVTVPLGYLLLLAASIFVVMPTARVDGGRVIDTSIMALSGAGLLWSFVLFPALAERDADVAERGYTLLIVLLVSGTFGAVLRAVVDAPRGRATLGYLLLASGSALVGNVGNVIAVDPATGASAHWVGLTWIIAYAATGAAVVHPAARSLATPAPRPARRLGPGALTFLGIALAVNPAIAGLRELAGGGADLLLLSLGSLLLVPLVLVRVSQLALLHARAEQELVHQATHDELTGLPNRRAVDRQVAEIVDAVRTGQAPGGLVCFLDLDGFKNVNDQYGHHVGDRLLAHVASRLRAAVRSDDFVARFGGDEFIIVLIGDPDRLQTETVQRLEDALAHEIDLGPLATIAKASIGTVVLRPGTHITASEVLSAADARMYAAKRRRIFTTGDIVHQRGTASDVSGPESSPLQWAE